MFYRNEIPEDGSGGGPTRVAYPWHEMEEYHPDGGMWQIPPQAQRGAMVAAAEQLMLDPGAFRAAMERAVQEWPRSVSVALTTPGLNKRAWLGHAGCWLVAGSPEETTRIAWHRLDDGEQYAANDAAGSVITAWEKQRTPTEPVRMFFVDGLWDA